MNYYQCELCKDGTIDHSWVEETLAQEGLTVKLKHLGTEDWIPGWTISKVYRKMLLTEDQIKAFRDAYKYQQSRMDT
jgi:hypothetical protein